MAFENKAVLRTVLNALEPNPEIRKASLELSGLPMTFILAANPNLDYLKEVLKHIKWQHSSTTSSLVSGNPLKSNPVPKPIKWFINFGMNLDKGAFRNEGLLLNWDEGDNEYFASRKGMSMYVFGSLIFNVSKQLENRLINLHDEINASMIYHEHYYQKALRFIAYGINMPADAPKEMVDTWKYLFRLFLVGKAGSRYRFDLVVVR